MAFDHFSPKKVVALVGCNFVISSQRKGKDLHAFKESSAFFTSHICPLLFEFQTSNGSILSLDQKQRKHNPLIPQNKATHHVPRFLRTLFSAKALNFVITVQVSYKIKRLFLLGLLKQKFFFLHKWVLQENGSKLL